MIAAVEDPSACTKCGKPEPRQDEDVLDTWFSSALWPFATLGWPEETVDLQKFYPTSVLVTARDIINLWVGRMIVTGLQFRGENPFRKVVINPTLLDDEGSRQSKSKGTGVDPLVLLEKYGADPLRFALAWLTTGTQDIKFGDKFSIQRVEMSRNFVTKLWNAARYVAAKMEKTKSASPLRQAPGKPDDPIEDRWILSRRHWAVEQVTDALERFDFGGAAQVLYSFVWDDFCDWYIELSKRRADEPAAVGTLHEVLRSVIRLLHPLMPFVTEEIWQRLGEDGSISKAEWPAPGSRDADLERRMDLLFQVVRGVREMRNRNHIPDRQPLPLIVCVRDEETGEILRGGSDVIRSQARIDKLDVGVGLSKPKAAVAFAHERFTAYIPLAPKDLEAERERTRKERSKTESDLERKRKQLANPRFQEARPDLAAQIEAQVADLDEKLQELDGQLKELETQ